MSLFSHDSNATYFNAILLETRKETHKIKASVERQSHLDLEILEDMSNWLLNIGHTRGRKKQY